MSSTVGCVILSMGTRQAELLRAIESVTSQRDVDIDVVVVGNGWEPTGLPPAVSSLSLRDNVGVPEGRNVGAAAVSGDLLLFLDDDAALVGDDHLARVVDRFDADPRLGVLQPRAVDPSGRPTAARHVPRPGGRHPQRPGDVAWFWEGCSVIRRSVLDAVGGWPGSFFYGHEGIEVAWRAIDAGYRVAYAADLEVHNPEAAPFRAPEHWYTNARNRVWVARRNLPWSLAVVYLAVWLTATVLRARGRGELAAVGRGVVDGVRLPCGERRRLRWVTVWRLTQLGRPPVV